MRQLSIAICEDSDTDRSCMKSALETSGVRCSCDWFESGEDFLDSFSFGKYDLVFLDVYMKELTGVDVAQSIRAIDHDVMLAFVTTSSDFALDGYKNRVERYLLKPYKEHEIHEALDSALQRKMRQEATLSIVGETISHSQICYAEQKNHTTVIYLANGSELRRTGRLDDIEHELPGTQFYRCHKSFLVNLDHVKSIDRDLNAFEMDNGRHAYIRRASMREARQAFESRLIERTKALG